METSRITLTTLMCVVFSSQKSTSGTEVEMRVRRGDNATFYCDCDTSSGSYTTWFRNCSHDHQPPLIIEKKALLNKNDQRFQRFHFVYNFSSQSHDLVVEKVTEKDLGLYYCAKQEKKFIADKEDSESVFYYGTLITRLSLAETATLTLPVSECRTLLFTVCPVCVLLSSLLSSTCVYCLCHNKSTDVGVDQQGSVKSRTGQEVGGDELLYTSVDFSKAENQPKKKRVQNVHFCTYSEVRTDRV